VRTALESNRPLSELTPRELAAADGALAQDPEEVYELLRSPDSWVESKISAGGTALARVNEQMEGAQELLDGYRRG
jgi:argininosuccinate lyase